MSDKKIRTMVMAAVLAALACVATMVVQIPSPMNGYVNLGDCFVLLSGWLLGPWWGAAAGGIGFHAGGSAAGLRPLCAGYAGHQGPDGAGGRTGLQGLRPQEHSHVVSGVVSEVIMVAGYFGYAALLLGKGIGAAASIPGNLVQGAVGLVIGLLLLQARAQGSEEKVSV